MTIIENYEVLKQIGEGGFGRIYQAEHKILKEKACLKQNLTTDRDHVRLLRYESKLLWKLDEHHSIPSVKDFYELDRENAVMVMKYIEGKTLEDIVKKKGPIHPEDVCWITERLLAALYYSHCNGVIHSDVKPANVFVEPHKRDIKLIDFGLASFKPKGDSKPLGHTPVYAAPELKEKKPPIPETDIYGAGMVMLHALGGDVLKKSFKSDIPEPIVEFCQTLLKYNPTERPNWEKDNPLEKLSDLRLEVFGTRHHYDKASKKMLNLLKGGDS